MPSSTASQLAVVAMTRNQEQSLDLTLVSSALPQRGWNVRKKVWIEGIVLLAAGLIGVVDGLRLVVYRNPKSIEDLTGPGRYLLAVGVLLVIVAVCFLFAQWRAQPVAEPVSTADKASRTTFAYTVAVLIAYAVLIDLVGYLISTSIFFVLILRVFGFKSWLHAVLLGLAMSAVYYVLFMRVLEMPFPHGVLFS